MVSMERFFRVKETSELFLLEIVVRISFYSVYSSFHQQSSNLEFLLESTGFAYYVLGVFSFY
jgi:hypothetical protein